MLRERYPNNHGGVVETSPPLAGRLLLMAILFMLCNGFRALEACSSRLYGRGRAGKRWFFYLVFCAGEPERQLLRSFMTKTTSGTFLFYAALNHKVMAIRENQVRSMIAAIRCGSRTEHLPVIDYS